MDLMEQVERLEKSLEKTPLKKKEIRDVSDILGQEWLLCQTDSQLFGCETKWRVKIKGEYYLLISISSEEERTDAIAH